MELVQIIEELNSIREAMKNEMAIEKNKKLLSYSEAEGTRSPKA